MLVRLCTSARARSISRHERLALLAGAVFVGRLATAGCLAREPDERCLRETHAKHLGIGYRGDVDGPARLDEQARELRQRLFLDGLRRRARLGEREIGRGRHILRIRDPVLQGATFEVVPEPGEPRALRFERRHVHHGLGRAGLGAAQLFLSGLTLRELAAVVLGEMLPALALFLLPHEVARRTAR